MAINKMINNNRIRLILVPCLASILVVFKYVYYPAIYTIGPITSCHEKFNNTLVIVESTLCANCKGNDFVTSARQNPNILIIGSIVTVTLIMFLLSIYNLQRMVLSMVIQNKIIIKNDKTQYAKIPPVMCILLILIFAYYVNEDGFDISEEDGCNRIMRSHKPNPSKLELWFSLIVYTLFFISLITYMYEALDDETFGLKYFEIIKLNININVIINLSDIIKRIYPNDNDLKGYWKLVTEFNDGELTRRIDLISLMINERNDNALSSSSTELPRVLRPSRSKGSKSEPKSARSSRSRY
jgi:hypothetical protein